MKSKKVSILALAPLDQKILKVYPDDGSSEQFVETPGLSLDSIVVDLNRGHIYVTNMGTPTGPEKFYDNDGSIERYDLNGLNGLATVYWRFFSGYHLGEVKMKFPLSGSLVI